MSLDWKKGGGLFGTLTEKFIIERQPRVFEPDERDHIKYPFKIDENNFEIRTLKASGYAVQLTDQASGLAILYIETTRQGALIEYMLVYQSDNFEFEDWIKIRSATKSQEISAFTKLKISSENCIYMEDSPDPYIYDGYYFYSGRCVNNQGDEFVDIDVETKFIYPIYLKK